MLADSCLADHGYFIVYKNYEMILIVINIQHFPTSQQNFSQRSAHSGAIPPTIPKLMLTLSGAHLDPLGYLFE